MNYVVHLYNISPEIVRIVGMALIMFLALVGLSAAFPNSQGSNYYKIPKQDDSKDLNLAHS